MKTEKFYPDVLVTPGEVILEHMEANSLNQKELAKCIGVSIEHMYKILNGNKAIDLGIALAMENVFGMPSSFWINLENNYQENLKRHQATESAE